MMNYTIFLMFPVEIRWLEIIVYQKLNLSVILCFWARMWTSQCPSGMNNFSVICIRNCYTFLLISFQVFSVSVSFGNKTFLLFYVARLLYTCLLYPLTYKPSKFLIYFHDSL